MYNVNKLPKKLTEYVLNQIKMMNNNMKIFQNKKKHKNIFLWLKQTIMKN